jgi:Trp operon repressor
MKKKINNKKFIIITLMLILVISNFSLTFAFWASSILSDQSNSNSVVQIGSWNYEDTEQVVIDYRAEHAYVLSLNEETVQVSDKTLVELALSDYGLLSNEAKTLLADDYNLLLSLLAEIISFENSEFLDFEGYAYDSGLTGTVVMNGRTWYGNAVYISNDPNYDVWNDTRSLALKMGAYFESRNPFVNGVDKITIYHGALNFDNGATYGFKLEYELQTNPGVWLTLQDNGSDLIIDVTSATPLGFSEINVNITEAIDIRFTPVISNTTDYINLDDIRIYEQVVTSQLEVDSFRTIYAGPLGLTTGTVIIGDKTSVLSALSAYDLLSIDAQNALTTEKALLDNLIIEIELQEDYHQAENAVALAENTFSQIHLDAAQLLVNALPSSAEKTALQNRLNIVQSVINEVDAFLLNESDTLELTLLTVQLSDKPDVEQAILAYNLLSASARNELLSEKALLDSLLAEINSLVPTETLVNEFLANHAVALSLTTQTVDLSDLVIVNLALDAYNALTNDAKAELLFEKALLDDLFNEIELIEATNFVEIAETSNLQADVNTAFIYVNALPTSFDKTSLINRLNAVQAIIDSVTFFRSDYETVLDLTTETVVPGDKQAVEDALAAYGLLADGAKELLLTEKDLLLALLTEIISFENSEFLDFEGYAYDSGLTGTVVMNGRTWYGNAVYISNDPNYDVWNDTRSLALRTGAYYESRTPFANGIDKISIYHGALNFDNGASYGFKLEYELQTNPGVWLTLQEGGTDLIIDITSATPLGFSEINVNITQAIDIRFTPVISNSTDYINLDDIRIYENVVSSQLEVNTFLSLYSSVLGLTVSTVDLTHLAAVSSALSAYNLLSVDAKNLLLTEKALLDDLYDVINILQDLFTAEQAVLLAESSFDQIDLDAAQTLVSALPSSSEKTALQNRIDVVQLIINEVQLFRTTYQDELALTLGTVEVTDKADIEVALGAYTLLSNSAKTELSLEKALLDSLLAEINSQTPTETQVLEYLTTHAAALSLTTGTVTISDQAIIMQALNAYDLLTPEAKAELISEKALLDSLILEIDLLIAEEAVLLAETTNLQTDLDSAQMLVSALPSSTAKTALQVRLDQVQDVINQLAADIVMSLINALPVPGEITLNDELDLIDARFAFEELTLDQKVLVSNIAHLDAAEIQWIALDQATTAVTYAESTETQADHDAAQALVNTLLSGTPKTILQTRLDALQDIIDVNEAQATILSYFAANPVVVSNLNNNTIKQTAFLAKANEIVSSFGVNVAVNSYVRISRTNSTYNITVTKNSATVTFTVSVTFTR